MELQKEQEEFQEKDFERFDQDHYWARQEEVNRQREAKVRELFPPPTHPIRVDWSNLNFSVPTKKKSLFKRSKKDPNPVRHILKDLNGSVEPGEFLAILGPSGAGKTTFLHSLAGRIPLKPIKHSSDATGLTGSILINGVDRDKTSIDQESCFVLQEDIFFGELTVRQTLRFTANLSMPRDVSVKQKNRHAEEVIELLRLKKCANTCVGSILRRGISGGEKKRLNIANELLSKASLVLMDEPTSGLDASTALLVVSLLSDLAKGGRTVIATLHQPSSAMFHMFDKLLILADGQTAYLGKAKDAVAYFSRLGFECPAQFNPSDYFLNILDEIPSNQNSNNNDGTYRTALLAAYQRNRNPTSALALRAEAEHSDSDDDKPLPLDISTPPPLPNDHKKGFQASYWTQMWLLAKRGAKQHMIEAIPNFIMFLIMSALSSIFWWQLGYREDDISNRAGLLFFVIWNGFIFPMFSAISELATERKVIRKERPSRLYGLSAYILSKTIANIPIDALSPMVMAFIVYWTCNLNAKFSRFVIFCVLSFFGQLSGMGIGIALGVNFDRPETATPWVIIVFFLFTITGGFFVKLSDVPSWIQWTQYTSLIKFWTDALMVNEFDDSDHVFKGSSSDHHHKIIITGRDFLEDQDLIFGYKVWPGMLILVGSYIAAQVLAYLLLRWHTQKKN